MDSVRELMAQLIDYAGMFPPARLPLETALKNFFEYRQSELGRRILNYFLCPTREIGLLVDLYAKEEAPLPLAVSAIGGGGQNLSEFLNLAGDDFRTLESVFGRESGPQVRLIEFKVPPSLCTLAQMDAFNELLLQTAGIAESRKCGSITPYYEISFAPDWADAIPQCTAAVADFNKGWPGEAGFRRCGVKIRTGGVEAAQFPTVEQVALWIESCARVGVAFKATAGLHHPIRHYSSETNCKMHGFVNVFLAAALAYARRSEGGIDRNLLIDLLNEERPNAFTPSPEGISFNDILITTEQIHSARRDFAHSYGSCSFLEPVADLQRMNWLIE